MWQYIFHFAAKVSVLVTLFSYCALKVDAQQLSSADTSAVILSDTVKSTALFSSADDGNEKSPLEKILPLSPQAAALARYGEYPVSHATGVPDISIPLYNIKLGNFTLPISISYHASGIKVDDVASAVGLGWSLNAGGVIARSVRGLPDLKESGLVTQNYNVDYWSYEKCREISKDIYRLDKILPMDNENTQQYDTESDRYVFNFACKSGVFVYSMEDSAFIPLNHYPFVIEAYGGENSFFRVADTDGTDYYFEKRESSGNLTDEGTTDVSAWYLTKVCSIYGDIILKYEKQNSFVAYKSSNSVRVGESLLMDEAGNPGEMSVGVSCINYSATSRFKCEQNFITSIEWNGNKIEFSYADDREDPGITRLVKMTVYDFERNVVKTVDFNNKSFFGSSIYTNGIKHTSKRMLLESLRISGNGKYSFDYNKSVLPPFYFDTGLAEVYRSSSDYWGYCNGSKRIKGIPRHLVKKAYDSFADDKCLHHDFDYDEPENSRNPDFKYASMLILTAITYPTGGTAEFMYELNAPVNKFGGLRIKSISYGAESQTFDYLINGCYDDIENFMWTYKKVFYWGNFLGHGFADFILCNEIPVVPASNINTSGVFYPSVRETFANGECIEYRYDKGTCADMSGLAQEPERKGLQPAPQLADAALNDEGIVTPYIKEKIFYDINGDMIRRESYEYVPVSLRTITTGTRIYCPIVNLSEVKRYYASGAFRIIPVTLGVTCKKVHGTIKHICLKSIQETDCITGVTKKTDFSYDSSLRTLSPKTVTVENSDGKKLTAEYTYAFEMNDSLHKKMTDSYFMFDTPVCIKKLCNNRLLSSEMIEYRKHDNIGWFFPYKILKSVNGNGHFEKYRFDTYDNSGNATKLTTNSCDTDSITWGYGGMYPMEHLHNGFLMSTYSWKPLCGVSSIWKPNGYAVYYGYDAGGRLSSVSDSCGTRQRFDYHYSNGADNNPFNAYNYVKTTNVLSADEAASNTTMQYADGMGRPVDNATDATNEHGTFVHSFSSYDSKGRTARTWLPVVSTDGCKMLDESSIPNLALRTYNDGSAFSDLAYDALDRTVFSSTPGTRWQGKGKKIEYIGNGKKDVRLFSAPLDKITLVDNGFYESKTLQGKRTTDEDGHSLTVFTDKLGRKVLERRNEGNVNNDTYFVYNDLGQLRYVLSPEYQRAGYKEKHAYEYRYDGRGNVVKRILPGCEPVQYWYDRGDRLTFMQDATLREKDIYRFFLYDRLGRTVVQGLCSGCNRSEEVNIAEFRENVGGICNTGYVFPLSDKITDPNLETVNYYDDYGFLQEYSAELGNLISDFQVKESCAQGLQTGKVQVASDGEKVIDAFFYDAKGQIVDTRRLIDKRLTCIHTDYSYTGKPVRIVTNEYSVDDGSKSLVVSQIQENTYSKKTDKLLSSTLSVNGKKETIQKFDYDDLGRVKSITRGGNAGAVTYGYNLHGWTTSIDSRDFHEELHYTDGVGTPCYNGNISSQLWSTSDYGQVRGYKFEYDGLDRLKEAVYGETPSLSDKQNRYNEKVMEYTANGAMKRFQRRGRKDNGEYGKIDNLNIKLNGNRLLSVTDDALPANKYSSFNFIDGANEQTEYEYNGVGALTKDLNRGITIKYDNLNNPRRIDFKDGNSITYTYLPDGTLIRKGYGEKQLLSPSKLKDNVSILDSLTNISGRIDSADSLFMDNLGMIVTGNTEYSGNIIYRNGKLYKVLFPGGYCTFNKGTSEPIFHYFTQDHLGNNRIVTNEDGTVEQITHYYPFGGTLNDAGSNAGLQQYKYNGKELDRIAGLNTYDYGARQYFPSLPIWDRMDSKCEEEYQTSPYSYCRNNPIKFIDNDGNKVRIPIENQRSELLSYTGSYFQQGLNVDKDGFIFISDKNIVNENGSKIFTDNLIEAINNKELTINLRIAEKVKSLGKTISVSQKGDGATYYINEKEIGSVITGKSHVVYDKNNQPLEQSPADILMHEIFGHAIPKVINADYSTGNAIKNENIIRRELNLKERIENEDKE